MSVPAVRPTLATVAVAACLPYVLLKVAWLTGSNLGLSDAHLLHSGAMSVANAGTLAMEVVGATLAVALAREVRWRLPGWLLVVPMFVGTGLLGGILLIVPAQLVVRGVEQTSPSGADDPIADWVYATVYTGFTILGLCLLTLFAWHARERWLRSWSTRLGGLPPTSTGQRTTVFGLAGAMLVASVTELLVSAADEGADAHQLVAVVASLAAAAAAAGLVLRCPPAVTARLPLLVGFVGCAVVAAWGLYLAVILTVPNPLVGERDTPVLLVAALYARAVTGTLLTAAMLRLRPAR